MSLLRPWLCCAVFGNVADVSDLLQHPQRRQRPPETLEADLCGPFPPSCPDAEDEPLLA